MAYCASRFRTVRRRAREVRIGSVGVGGDHPIRLQSMTTSDTQDVAATVRQAIALAEVGCEIVRVTAPNVAAAQCLKPIRERLSAAGFGSVPLVADIHFLPSAAMEAVEHVEKVRVNPGNYADKKRFAVREYSDADYELELQRLHDAFSPLVKRCRELGRSMRIGTNHGSLSDRIMNRYGDTPLGMVESALEFLRICEAHDFHEIVLSMKASNPKVMIEAYRLLVERMQLEAMHYPLHLGVTEAGDGEDGRIKSAIGIGSLLFDGLGDTIRVSLTEDSVYEIPVARALAEKAMSLWRAAPSPSAPEIPDSIDPFHFAKRETAVVTLSGADVSTAAEALKGSASGAPLAPVSRSAVGGENLPRVVVRMTPEQIDDAKSMLREPQRIDTPAEGILLDASTPAALGRALGAARKLAGLATFAILDLGHATDLAPIAAVLGATSGSGTVHRSATCGAAASPGTQQTVSASYLRFDAVHAGHVAGKPGGSEPPPFPQKNPASGDTSASVGAPAAASIVLLRRFSAGDAAALRALAELPYPLICDMTADACRALAPALQTLPPGRLIVTWSGAERAPDGVHPTGEYRRLAEAMAQAKLAAPLWIRATAATAVRGDHPFLSRLLEASVLAGSLVADGLGNVLSVETEPEPGRALRVAYNVLQGAGARATRTEFVACPSCGRTLFDLQTTTRRIREQTGHLKGVKLAIMGCIVNGPGEMADADFGYVGGAPGKINLYVGKRCVQYNLPQAEADARLIALIKEHGKWTEPPVFKNQDA